MDEEIIGRLTILLICTIAIRFNASIFDEIPILGGSKLEYMRRYIQVFVIDFLNRP